MTHKTSGNIEFLLTVFYLEFADGNDVAEIDGNVTHDMMCHALLACREISRVSRLGYEISEWDAAEYIAVAMKAHRKKDACDTCSIQQDFWYKTYPDVTSEFSLASMVYTRYQKSIEMQLYQPVFHRQCDCWSGILNIDTTMPLQWWQFGESDGNY